MVEHLAQHWGDWASVVGLLFSILAFLFARRASEAAEEARNSVLRRSLTDDMNEATRMAGDIVGFVDMERGDMALLRAGDLLSQTSYCLKRWENRMPSESRLNVIRARTELEFINSELRHMTIPRMTPRARIRLVKSCRRVSIIFNEEFGGAVKATDEVN